MGCFVVDVALVFACLFCLSVCLSFCFGCSHGDGGDTRMVRACVYACVPYCRYLHLFMIGVAPEGRDRGVGQKLFVHNVALARRKGFKAAFAECTAGASTHLFKK